jgi:arylsulfatase A-like enzyme
MMNMRNITLGLLLAILLGGCVNLGQDQGPPNIIFILADDLGWMDLETYGSQYYETPNLTRLAGMGMSFTNAYTANPLCSPTRASIMTGRHPGRFFLTLPAGHLPPNPDEVLMAKEAAPWQKMICPKSRTFMPLEEYTIAEALKAAGYTTAHIGKWHLGHRDYWPDRQGFDINIGGAQNPGPPSYFAPYKIETLPDGPDREYITDRCAEEAVRFIENHKEGPFFLNYWQFPVHAPYQAHLDLIQKYSAKKDPRDKQRNPIMGAMIESLDNSIGLLLDKLEELDILDNTLIVFFSDNGGNEYDIVNGEYPTNNDPLRYGKGNIYEGGIRVPCIVVWHSKVKPGTTSSEIIQSIDFYPTLLEVAGLKPRAGLVLDGVSLMPLWTKNKALGRKAIFSHYPHYVTATNNLPTTAAWSGKWKLHRQYGEGPDRTNGYKLYNLEEDIGETNDLADQYPDIVKELDQLITEHLRHIGAIIPVVNPVYDPGAESPMGKQHDFPLERYPSY